MVITDIYLSQVNKEGKKSVRRGALCTVSCVLRARV